MTLLGSMLLLAVRRPHRIPAIVGLGWAFRARGWYRRFPFVPWPPSDYLRWRMDTAYGAPDATPPLEELERFVVWASRMRAHM